MWRDAEVSDFIGLELRQRNIRLAVSRAQPNHVPVVRDVLVSTSGIGHVVLITWKLIEICVLCDIYVWFILMNTLLFDVLNL